MPTRRSVQLTSQSRVFLIEDRAGPANTPSYQALGRAQGISWAQGDVTPVRIPDPDQYGRFITVDEITGQQGLPQLGVQFRLTRDLSEVLRLIRKGCPLDLQLHIGECKNPQDFNGGWEKIIVLEGAHATDYSTEDLGAMDADQNAPIYETVPWVGNDLYELKGIAGTEIAAATITQEIVATVICDSRSCGACGLPSDGCQRVFALTVAAGGSPGLPNKIVFTQDGGATIDSTTVTSLGGSEDGDDMTCVGEFLVVVSNDSDSAHYAEIVDIIAGTDVWTEVTTGFAVGGPPNAIFSLSRSQTWIVGDGGYIYFSPDITAGVTVQSAGGVTVQNLADIHGVDEDNLIAVGAANVVLRTDNGGDTWSLLVGPAPAVALTSCFMRSELEWFIGTAGGNLYYTRDGGTTWTLKAFPGSGAGSIAEISFPTPTVGYMAHNVVAPAAAGYLLRSIDGGHSWYRLPEAAGLTLPTSDAINSVAACGEDANVVYAGGLGANGTDGIWMKVA